MLIKSPACPNIESLHSQPDYYTRVESRRTVLKTASVSCKDIIASWSSGAFSERPSQKFSSGGFGWDYQKDVYGKPETCPPDSFILGVDDDTEFCGLFDSKSLGFAGNLEVAKSYCNDYPRAPCCEKLASSSRLAAKDGSAPSAESSPSSSQNKQSLAAQAADSSPVENASQSSSSAGTIIGSICAAIGAVLIAAVAVVTIQRRRSHTAVATKEPAAMTSASSNKYRVIHEYHQALPDEVELRKGDIVVVEQTHDDGWCKGKNLTTGGIGMCPIACLSKE